MFLAGCSSSGSEKLTLALGGTPDEILVWEELIRGFEQESGIAVELQRQPTDSDQRRQGLVVALSARRPDPDVFLMDVAWLAQFAASGWLAPLEKRLVLVGVDTDVFFTRVLDLADRYQGNLVALPIYIDAGLLYYRKDLLEESGFHHPPETWEELIRMAQVVQEV